MAQHGKILHQDPFCFYRPPLPWIDYEWLFEISFAQLAALGNLPLAYCVGFIIFALIPVLFWRLLLGESILWPVAFIYTLAIMVFFRAHFVLRPLLFTYIFMLWIVQWWYRHPQGPGRIGWLLLLPVFILWANLHVGFTAALIFLGLSIVGRGIDQWQKRQPL